ncbi:MAG: ribonuclease HI [Bacteroidales bacterium]|nr:ribonuclease HI [Bacteroidales bacterium]
MKIINSDAGFYDILIFCNQMQTLIKFNPCEKFLVINEDKLGKILQKNEYQLRKILHNKRKNTFYTGFKLNFVLNKNIDAIAFNDLSKLVVYDNRNQFPKIYVKDKYIHNFITVYTDGSYSEKKKICAYVVLVKNSLNKYDIKFGIKQVKNSSLIEMIAVIEGLKEIADEEKIRIVTDSRYVIKGLTEWMYNWKLNDWHTAQGEKVKNIDYWKEYEVLTQNKYLEFEWVKAHNFHFENSICDRYAKELIGKYV